MASSEVKSFGDVRVDAAAERVWKAGELVELEPKAFGVLRFLIAHPGRLVSKQELLDAVWNGVAVTDNALTRVIAQLRRAIGDDARDARYIETVPTRGYRFIAQIRDDGGEAGGVAAPPGGGRGSDGIAPAPASSGPSDASTRPGRLTQSAIGSLAPLPDLPSAASNAPAQGETTEPRSQPPSAAGAAATSPPRAGWWPGAAFGAGLVATIVIVMVAIGFVWMRSSGRRPSASGATAGGATAGDGSVMSGDDRGLAVAAVTLGAGKSARPIIDNTLISQATFSLELDAFPAFSPDGTMLVYSSVRRGNLNLFVKTFAPGGQERQVTDDGQQNVQADWSPDGQFLAYHSIGRGGIWAIPITGGTVRQIAAVGSAPRWSPDGKSVIYQTGEVHSLDTPSLQESATLQIASFPEQGAPDGRPRPLTQPGRPMGGHSQPSWSADGTRVVFTVRHPGPVEFWTVTVADGALTRLMVCEQVCSNPRYDVDGRGLFYTTGEPQRGIWRVALSDDGRQTAGAPVLLYAPIDSEVSSLAVRRDEPRLAFGLVTTRSNLEAITLSPRQSGMLQPEPVTQDTSTRNMWPAISPDGRMVAYVSRRSGAGHHIWVAGVDGSNARQLTLMRIAATGLQGWLPNGDEVAYISYENGRLALRASSITTGRMRELRPLPSIEMLMRAQMMHPRLMPDAEEAVYAKVVDGIPNLWLRDRQITHEPEGASFPSPSRDGRWIAYEAMQGGDMQLGIVSADGSGARLMTSGRGLTWAHSFSPDSERIALAYRRDGLWRIGTMARTSGQPQSGQTGQTGQTGQIVPLTAPAPANAFVRYPEWSPRDGRIIYEHAKTTGNIWMARLPSSPSGWTAGTRY